MFSIVLVCISSNGMYLTRNVARLIFFDDEELSDAIEDLNVGERTDKYINSTLTTLYQNGLENVSTRDLIELSLIDENKDLSAEISKSVEQAKEEVNSSENKESQSSDEELFEPVSTNDQIIID